jgi:NTP pyrophosphatase (non-canonical NTP hydrolase)
MGTNANGALTRAYLEATEQTEPNGPQEREYYALGLCGEAGEVAELVKKEVYHGRPALAGDVAKEMGDVLWYLVRLARSYGWTLEELLEINAMKLALRYPRGYSHAASAARLDTKEG